ncbi:S8 family serine peptidase [Georgenia phoenicis]|uniref:S8 family serine peptidase n=1 Tax=unclassified Georgenia TaxID=2626815 RepID=UPI0039B08323
MIVSDLPLLALRQAKREQFVTRRSARSPEVPHRDRRQQAAIVLAQIDAVTQQIAEVRHERPDTETSAIVTAVGPGLGDPMVSRKLVSSSSGSELLVSDDGRVTFRVTDNLGGLRKKVLAYAAEDTAKGNPRFRDPIARIDEVTLASIADLSLGEIRNDVPDDDLVWVEIWTRGGARLSSEEQRSIDAAVMAFASLTENRAAAVPVFRGPERDVHVLQASGAALKALPALLPDAAEVHLAPTVFPIVLAEAQDAAGELAEVDPPPEGAIVVAVHDSGIDSTHPYISPILVGAGSVVPGVLGSADTDGHGTQMAGVVAYSALADGISGGILHADAWLVAMRLLETAADAGGDPERGVLWAERTAESVDVAESLSGDRPVVHNISIGADIPAVGKTDRTSWSVAADVLAWNGGRGRLLVVASGNADTMTDPADYPYVNLGPPHLQQPGQAWNVLTVGGYTALETLTAEDAAMGYPTPLAAAGQLSPHRALPE